MSPISENSTISSNNSESNSHPLQRSSVAAAPPHLPPAPPTQPVPNPNQMMAAPAPKTVGFNASCQQCLAERANSNAASRPVSRVEFAISDSTNSPSANLNPIPPGEEFQPSQETLESLQNIERNNGQRTPLNKHFNLESNLKEIAKLVASCSAICLILITYLSIGGFLFMALENSDKSSTHLETPTVMNITVLDLPSDLRSRVDKARSETVQRLWQATEKMNIFYPENWTRQAMEEMLWFQVYIITKIYQSLEL